MLDHFDNGSGLLGNLWDFFVFTFLCTKVLKGYKRVNVMLSSSALLNRTEPVTANAFCKTSFLLFLPEQWVSDCCRERLMFFSTSVSLIGYIRHKLNGGWDYTLKYLWLLVTVHSHATTGNKAADHIDASGNADVMIW